jgi:hypothetical protein
MEGFAKAATAAGVAPEQVSTLVKLAHRVSLQKKFPAAFDQGFKEASESNGLSKVAGPTGTMMKLLGRGALGGAMVGGAGWGAQQLFGSEGAMPLDTVMDWQDRRFAANQRAIKRRQAQAFAAMSQEQQDAQQLRDLKRAKIFADQQRAIIGPQMYPRQFNPNPWANPYAQI